MKSAAIVATIIGSAGAFAPSFNGGTSVKTQLDKYWRLNFELGIL